MRAVSKIDGQNNFAGDVLLVEGAPLPAGCIESRPPEGFYAPRWSGFEWMEGKPQAEILDGLKAQKVEEMAARAIEELAPMFTPNAGRDETALLVAGHVLKICEALGIPPDPRLTEVVATGEKALAKKAEVEAAATIEEMEAVTWT
jgi:hypothetical protein